MKVTKNEDLSLTVSMSLDEFEEGVLMAIAKYSKYKFLPYKITKGQRYIFRDITLTLDYIPKGAKRNIL